MSHIFPRNCSITLPQATKGEGCYIIDSLGRRYFDASGGAAVSCLGHSNQRVINAIKTQVDKICFAHTSFFTTSPAEELADILTKQAPGDINRVYFVSGGSEAIESALKLARQYFLEQNEPQRRHVISRRQSYHGNTLGALAAGGNVGRRNKFEPLLVKVSHIAPCYEYAEKNHSETRLEYLNRITQELEDEIHRLGAENVMAFIAEPVVGATMGAVAAIDGYFKKIRQICDRHNILLILDEVMCGMGRTGHMFAYEAEEIVPDIVCIAKGLGAGYQPIGAMLCSEKIYNTIAKGSRAFQHGHTYIGHPVACAAALAVVKEILEKDLISQVKKRGKFFEQNIKEQFAQHPNIGDIRGRGLFWGLEFVSNLESKQPFDPELKIASRVKSVAFEEGIICYPMAGTRDGKNGDHVLLAPPFIASEQELVHACSMLKKTIDRVINEIVN